MWLVKKGLPPEGLRGMNLFRLVIVPFFIGRSEISRWTVFRSGGPPCGCQTEERVLGEVSPMNRHRACSIKVETLLGREISGIAGYRRPEQGRHIHRVVARFGLHQRQLAAHIVLDALELFRSSLHAMTLQCARMETSPLLCASFRYSQSIRG